MSRQWTPESFGEAIASQGFTFVIYDSLREAISQLGGDPNLDPDISRFIDLAVTPLVRRGIAVATLDNTGHEAKNRPKGSGSKLDAIPQAFKVTQPEIFTPAQLGRIEIECTRSRFGDIGRRWTMRVGDGTFDLPVARDESPDAKRARDLSERKETLCTAVIKALRPGPLGRDPLIKSCREQGVKGQSDRLRSWLSELAADPTSGFDSTEHGYALTPDPNPLGQGGVNPPEDPLTPTPRFLKDGGRGSGPDPGANGSTLESASDEELRGMGLEPASAEVRAQ